MGDKHIKESIKLKESFRNTILLSGMFIKSSFRGMAISGFRRRGALPGRKAAGLPSAALYAILAIAILPTVAMMSVGASRLISVAKELGVANLVVGQYLAAISLVMTLLCLYEVISEFYLSKGDKNVLPFPIRPYEVVFAKFATVLVYEMLAQLFLLAPMLIIYGIHMGTPQFCVYAALFYFLFPLVPVIIASLVAMPLKPLIRRIKNTDYISSAMLVLMLLGVVLLSMFMTRTSALSNEFSEDQIISMLNSGDVSAFGVFSRVIPTVRFASLMFANSGTFEGLGYFAVFIAINAAFVAAFFVCARVMFAKGAFSVENSGGSSMKAFDKNEFLKKRGGIFGSSVLFNYALKEFRVLLRTPIFFFNCAAVSLLWPFIMLFAVFFGSGNAATSGGASASDYFGELSQLFAMMRGFLEQLRPMDALPLLIAVGFGSGLIFGCMTSVSPTAISREGKDFYFNKYMPLSANTILIGKIIPAFALGGINVLFVSIIAYLFVWFPLWFFAVLIPLAAAGIAAQGFYGLVIDILMPKLNWESETEAVKQNLNVIFNMGVSCAAAALTVCAALFLPQAAGSAAALAITLSVAAVFTVAGYITVTKLVSVEKIQ